MSKRSLGCVVLVIVGWSSAALANLTSDPSPVDAGPVAVNGTNTVPATANSNVAPPGSDDLDHFTKDPANPDCALFTLTAALPASIDNTAGLPFTVKFDPIARGLETCSVTFRNAADASIGTAFTVRGTGVAPEITAPTTAALGSARVLDTSPNSTSTQTVVIQSTGDSALSITALTFPAGGGQFTIQSPPTLPATIAVGNSLTLTVVFNPSGAGPRSGTLRIASNDPLDAAHDVTLSGTGTNGRIATADLAFGTVNLGGTSTQTIAVTNSGAAPQGPLTLTSGTITGGGGAFTFADNGFGCSGAACTFTGGIVAPQNIGVRCSPTGNQTGTLSATVTFASDTDAGGDNTSAVTCVVGRPDATVSPSPVVFGNVAIGASPVRTVTVNNVGTTDLTFTVSKSGARAAEYTLTGCTTACVVAPATSETFDLTFTPTLPRGGANITLTITSNDPDNGTITDNVTANVTAPVIGAANVNFPSRRVANAAVLTATAPVAITNTGDAPLSVTALAISGANASDFTIPTPPTLPATIAPAGTLNVNVTFDPSAAGSRTASFDITSNDPATPSKSATLTGIGTTAVIAVTDVSFGTVTLGQTGTQSIAVTNASTNNPGPLTIASATITGGAGWFTFDANGFGCLGNTTCTFGAGIVAPQNIAVRCTPPAGSSGSMSATVAFTSDSDGGGDNVSSLLCTAGRADATVDPTSLDYGNVDVGANVPRTVSVTNTGNITLTFTATKAGARAGEYTFTGCFSACAVAAGATRTFDLNFAPTSRGTANITVTVTSNDPDNGTINIPVTANAIAPLINSPAQVQFGNVEVVTTATQTLTIMNTGDADLLISTANFSTNDGSYAIVSGITGAQTVPPAGSASWDITCTPATQGTHDGQFRITSNALGAATRNVALRCTGTEGILTLSPTSIDFGGVAENTVATRSFTVTNTGNLTVDNIAAVLNPTTVGYSVDTTTPIPTTLAAGAQASINIKFSPLSGNDGGPATLTFSGTWGTGARPLRVTPVLTINGDGLTTGFDVTPAMLAFGNLRFDTTLTQTFCIVNTSQVALDIATLSIAPAVGTMTGEFTAPAIRRKTCGTAGGTVVVLPQTLLPNQQLEVTVVVNPADRTGAMAATLTVASNLVVNPTRTVNLTANSTTAMLVLDPATSVLEFGPRDVQAGPTTLPITITNAGAAPLDLTSFTRSDNGTNGHFTFALPPNTTLPPGGVLTIPVTYAPTVVTMPDESIVLANSVSGVLGAPATQNITIRGRGIDRDILVALQKDFPATYRNPGDAAPVEPIVITNTGEAPLHISATMVTQTPPNMPPACAPQQPEWSLMETAPLDVAPTSMATVHVKFAPIVVGSSQAHLIITNDDSDTPMADITLDGVALDRMIAFNGPTIDLGYTGIGIPVTVDDALSIINTNATDGFTIARIELAGAQPEVFAVEGSPVNSMLAANERRDLAMTFSPDGEGAFEATANLIIDSDPCPQANVTIRGTAVFVDAHGGGGCSIGGKQGGGGAGAGAIVLVLACVLRRRRAVAVLVVCIAAPAARADDIVLTVFDPTPATTGTNFQLQAPEVGKPGDWVVTAIVSQAMNPLLLDGYRKVIDPMTMEETTVIDPQAVVERSTLVEIGGAYAFLGRFEAGARMPFYSQSGEPRGDRFMRFTMDPANGGATGDLTLHGKVRLVNGTSGKVGALAQLTLPTATAGEYTGIDKPSARVLLLGTLNPDTLDRRIILSANFGGILRAKSTFANLEQGSGVAWGLGTSVRALDRVWIAAEIFGDIEPSARRETAMGPTVTLKPTEWLAGMRWFPDHRFSVALAAGRGLTSSAGSPGFRGLLSLTFAPGAPKIVSLEKPPGPDGDADGDGIADSKDRCPSEAEDADLFDDTDGCPDLDNDKDGVPDAADKCPLDPEDKDGFHDEDGCPDKDNDNDGIPDAADKCPLAPEDKDGFQDIDGCPDLDNDSDGIPDAKDKCPLEPETINGNKDDDGCPDSGDSVVVLSPDRIETLESIQFGGGARLTKGSNNVLGQVAATLRAHPEIIRVRVTCHVQPTTDPDKDQDLSEKRAYAVRDWLVQWGIQGTRVEARGFGSQKPLSPPSQRGSDAINNRIELIILERK